MMGLLEIIKHWNIGEVVAVENEDDKEKVYKVIDDKGKKYILKKKEDKNRVNMENDLLAHLHRKNVAVPVPFLNKNNEWYIESEGEYFCLYSYVEGEAREAEDFSAGFEERARVYGKALAMLHKGLEDYKPSYKVHKQNLMDSIFQWAMPKMKDNKKFEDTINILEELKEELEGIFNPISTQLIHRDPHPGNMVFSNGELVGYIDFELSVEGLRVFDLCYFAAGVLANNIHSEEKTKKWFKLLKVMIEGYEDISPLSEEERRALWHIFLAIETIFIAYFSGINCDEEAKVANDTFHWIYNNRERIVHID